MASISVYLLLASHFFCISNGLSSKLIYRDSPYSPLHQPSLSYLKAFQRDIQASRNRASIFMLRQDISIFFREPLFIVEVGIGTPPTKARLVFDTIAPLTWTQCKPCSRCFEQEEDYPVYDPTRSRSFKRLPRSHTLCSSFGCNKPECYYQVATGGGLASEGRLAMDTFSFGGPLREVDNIVFGCGTRNICFGSDYEAMMVTGVLGMGNYPTSLPHQLGATIMNRFSYCIPTLRSSETKITDLRFGRAAAFTNASGVQTTRFLQRLDGPLLLQSSYRVKLLGISVGGKRLELPPGSFNDGIAIDTGTPFSMIDKKAYDVVVNATSSYFSKWQNIKQVVRKEYPGQACYKYPKGFGSFPSMILHFDGAKLEINGTNLFMYRRGGFLHSNFMCLQMLQGPDIWGVYQQQNVRFLYDFGKKKLSFAKEDC